MYKPNQTKQNKKRQRGQGRIGRGKCSRLIDENEIEIDNARLTDG